MKYIFFEKNHFVRDILFYINNKTKKKNLPDKVCDNLHCARPFHIACLHTWFKSLPSTRQSFNTIFGNCPYCSTNLSIDVSKIKLNPTWIYVVCCFLLWFFFLIFIHLAIAKRTCIATKSQSRKILSTQKWRNNFFFLTAAIIRTRDLLQFRFPVTTNSQQPGGYVYWPKKSTQHNFKKKIAHANHTQRIQHKKKNGFFFFLTSFFYLLLLFLISTSPLPKSKTKEEKSKKLKKTKSILTF